MFPFQNLEIYKKSQIFHIECKKILGNLKAEKYVNDQLGRASYSIVLNIAEGSAKTSNADRKNYFTTSRGSLFECVAVLDLFLLEKRIEENRYQELLNLAEEISKMLYTMIKNLSA
jgi:four helix bundle protein